MSIDVILRQIQPEQRFSFKFLSVFEAEETIREKMTDTAEALGYERFPIWTALEEAFTNAIRHGNQQDPSKHVHVRGMVDRHEFRVTITDEGSGFNPDDVADPTTDEGLETPRGRGLLLMRHFMDEVTYSDRGNVVTLVKNYPSRDQETVFAIEAETELVADLASRPADASQDDDDFELEPAPAVQNMSMTPP